MRRYQKIISLLFSFILFVSVVSIPIATCCKDIVVTTPATAGDYNLLLKVRDPSRPGLQVLCRVPKGTMYTYHHPWTGEPWDFMVNSTFIGVATKGDTLPNIVKAGIALTDAGLAFGDADTGSNWINPSKQAWDDFDWMRYACQSAGTLEQAVDLLTTEAIDRLHATGVSENLFVVSPQNAVIIEADAVHHTTTPIHGILVMSNYPKDLWSTQLFKSLPLASSFDSEKETWVRQGSIIHLGSLCGVKIIQIGNNSLTAQAFPPFAFHPYGQDKESTISLGKRGTVGPYSVCLLDIEENKAQVSVRILVNAWEYALLGHIQPALGQITVKTMMNLSRLHTADLDSLRPLCEDAYPYEAVLISQLPKEHANVLSCGWFSANHACSSIYVPVHICDTDIYDPYETGEAAALSLELLQRYGHGTLTKPFQNVEQVLIVETEAAETIAKELVEQHIDVSAFLTAVDTGIQQQAFLTEQLWLNLTKISGEKYYTAIRTIIEHLWVKNYSVSLEQMEQAISSLKTYEESNNLIGIIENMIRSIRTSQVAVLHTIE